MQCGRQRPREEDDSDRGALLRPRLEVPSRRAFSSEILYFVESAQTRYPKFDVGQCCRQVLFEILVGCWRFAGSAADCFESVRQLPAFVQELLTSFGGYELSESGQYLRLRARGGVIPLFSVGALSCAIADITRCSEEFQCQQSFSISLVGCRSFLWNVSGNLVPRLSAGLAEAEVAVAWDTMITHAGSPAVANSTGSAEFSAHFRFGLGISTFVKKSSRWCPASCGNFVNDSLVGLALMLSMAGPMLIHVHAVREFKRSVDLETWSNELLAAPTHVIIVLSGPHAMDVAPILTRRATRLTLVDNTVTNGALVFGRAAQLDSCFERPVAHNVGITQLAIRLV